MKKRLREEPYFAPLKEYDVPQNTNLRSAFFQHACMFPEYFCPRDSASAIFYMRTTTKKCLLNKKF